jgi:hypothetical protein
VHTPQKKKGKSAKNNHLRALETHYFRGRTTPERRDDDDDDSGVSDPPLVVVVFIFFAEEESEKEESETATTTEQRREQFVGRNGNIRLESQSLCCEDNGGRCVLVCWQEYHPRE